jgi:DNA helicase-2/ATP-dependent DNA helicase PcrA
VPLETSYTPTVITEQDKKLFKEFDFFLEKFTYEQKKAIIDTSKKQLCIAGAGSGKTSVLTHKIAFLTRYLGVLPEKILAITFTRKAKQEMKERLETLVPGKTITVETFNSYAEKELLRKGDKIYTKQKRMASYKEFLTIVLQAISTIGFDLDTFLDHYFLPREKRGKEQRELFFSFLYDFRAILDTYIGAQGEQTFFNKKVIDLKLSEKVSAENILKICSLVQQNLEKQGLRTYSDQLVDLIDLYVRYPESKRCFDWILVDEYQDVNEAQVALLDLFSPENLFVVGDPRQSIYAWRGSNPNK